MTILVAMLAAFWLLVALHDLYAVATLPALPQLPQSSNRNLANAAVTVVIAIRNDADQIATTLHSMLRQKHVDLQLVVVNDRSNDDTGNVLSQLATEESRMRVVTVYELPTGWLGKCHALQRGTELVETPWLLFSDGDAVLSETALARAIAAAEMHGADHVSLLPNHRHTTIGGQACLLGFQLVIQRRVRAVNSRRQHSFVGTGAFNLVRTSAYRGIGAHERLRMEVVDDVFLGALLFWNGYRSRVWFAGDDFAIDWGGTPLRLIHVLEKNMFAMLRYQAALALTLALAAIALLAFTMMSPLLASIGWWPLIAYLAGALPAWLLARRLHWKPLAALLMPLMRITLPIALLYSTVATLRHGGVHWRGTFYPLVLLRKGMVSSGKSTS
jgi:glycosyltransferase involved in cell wall biosynthesis